MLLALLRKLLYWIILDLLFAVVRRWFSGEISLQKLADKSVSSFPKLAGKSKEPQARESDS